ncbi:hypothetical protein [Microbacterium testaceum]|nr:hypothetical protein [Microbacterium testaceum]MDZ5146062.1 hypothetical protein [Microbacterium testaceum]
MSNFSQFSSSLSAAAKRASGLLSEAEDVRSSALRALDLLPSATPPDALRDAAASAGLDSVLADAFAMRREWAAKHSAQDASAQLTTLGSQMSEVAAIFADSPDGDGSAAGTVTSDGRFRIGPPQQPSYTWDEDFIYGSESADFDDFLSSEKWKTKLAGARLLRPDLSDATEAYSHYWSNTGDDWQFDYEKAYLDDSGVRADVDQQIAAARQAAEELIGSGNSSFSFTGQPSVTAHYPTTENWQKAIGGHQQWPSGDVVVNGNTATMTVTVHADDHYNFNRGQADIASDAPDDENGRFTEIGWAKPFDSSGSVTRTVTWTVGDPSTVTVSPSPNEGR